MDQTYQLIVAGGGESYSVRSASERTAIHTRGASKVGIGTRLIPDVQLFGADRSTVAVGFATGRAMPNGRSGGFSVNKDRLKAILSALPEDAVIGKSVVGEVSVAAMLLMVSEFPDAVIAVEEQDYRWLWFLKIPMAI